MTHATISQALAEHRAVFDALQALAPQIAHTGQALATVLAQGGKILFCGNGGSASDCQHMAAELTGRFVHDRRPLAGLALTTDTSALTAIGNDYGFDAVFERQVRALGRPGDALVAISTSGNSRNVRLAVEAAHAQGLLSVGLLGRDGGELGRLCQQTVVVPSATTARIQEAHTFIGHLWCTLIEQQLSLGTP